MKKKLLIAIAAVLIIVIGIIVFVILNINPIVEKAVNTYGPKITKTAVVLDEADISIFSGSGKLKGLFVGNPKGFKAKSALEMDMISLQLDKGSLTSDQIVIDEIIVAGPIVTYEQTGMSTSNFEALMNNVKASTAAEKKEEKVEEAEDKGPGKTVLIKNFYLKDGEINLALTGLGGEAMTIPLPDMHLTNLGGDTPPGEVFGQILDGIYNNMKYSILNNGIDIFEGGQKLLKGGVELIGSGAEAIGDTAGDVVDGVGDTAGDVVDGVGDGAGDAVDGIGDTVDDITKSIF